MPAKTASRYIHFNLLSGLSYIMFMQHTTLTFAQLEQSNLTASQTAFTAYMELIVQKLPPVVYLIVLAVSRAPLWDKKNLFIFC